MLASLTPSFLPSFFILGANHGPLATVYDGLMHHAALHLPDNYSQYFSDDECYAKGLGTYYLKFTASSKQQLIGDVSTSYLYYPNKVIKRLKFLYNSELKHIKLVVCLPNPYLEFGLSALKLMEKQQGSSLSDLLLHEQLLLSDEWYAIRGKTSAFLLSAVNYAQLLKPWLAAFGEDNILLLHDFDLDESPLRSYRKLCRFLGIDPNQVDYEQRKLHAQQALLLRSNKQKVNKLFARFNQEEELLWADTCLQIKNYIGDYEKLTGIACGNWQYLAKSYNNTAKAKWLQLITRVLS